MVTGIVKNNDVSVDMLASSSFLEEVKNIVIGDLDHCFHVSYYMSLFSWMSKVSAYRIKVQNFWPYLVLVNSPF